MMGIFLFGRVPVPCIFCLCLLLSACTSLPDIRYLKPSLNPNPTPTIAGSQGTLPEKKADSILAKRLRNVKIDITALAALEEAATGSPLIAGNKVVLLFDGPQTMAA